LTVRRSEVGLFDEADGGPRETVAVDIFSEPVTRRDRGMLSPTMSAI